MKKIIYRYKAPYLYTLGGKIFFNRTPIFPRVIEKILTIMKVITKKNLNYYQ